MMQSTQTMHATRRDDASIGLGRRVLDVTVSAIVLLALAPLLAAVSAAIAIESPGAPIFRQTRIGQDGRGFTIYKFRTMRVAVPGPEVVCMEDPRVTPLGGWLRRSGLDELPQLVNVLFGQMTLVGPRPETPQLAARYPDAYIAIFRFRPGLTGPGQLVFGDMRMPQGEPGESFYFEQVVPRRFELDMTYLSNPTIRRTAAVLGRTATRALRSAVARPSNRGDA